MADLWAQNNDPNRRNRDKNRETVSQTDIFAGLACLAISIPAKMFLPGNREHSWLV